MSIDAAALRQTVTVKTPNGLHMIPCSMVAKLAQQFQSTIVLCKAEVRADAKRVLELLTLGAAHNTQLELEISGDDAADAMERICQLFDGDFSIPAENGA